MPIRACPCPTELIYSSTAKQKLTQLAIPAPSFKEFLFQNHPLAAPASLHPQESILPTKIQEITPEEFNRSIEAAERLAQAILALKLPRSCKRKEQDLVSSLTQSKQIFFVRWEESGNFPDDEDIEITCPSGPSSAKLSIGKPWKKSTTTRKPLVKPVNLLAKTGSSSTAPPAPVDALDATVQAGAPTTLPPTNDSPWADPPEDATSNNPTSGAVGMEQPTTDTAPRAHTCQPA
ncbi:hypothetical protein PTTG_04957 [Puccinia triticina 1-1 BBBD Race 1]|uniref:Uncharacterized protein n=1 Tax=Puccinia triticina (isolate 1-1 / race 1 (BBBD)) TaxID=630390 RepID=A0A180GJA3_PUCT1|nr:hypothetical protein PTTG_04957 [Puccinia triticina 1-1 BBBD Race 1]